MKSHQRLGFRTYREYIASPHWQDFKQRYYTSGLPTDCMCCRNPRAQLHHHTYERFGREELGDVLPLCGACHSLVHRYLRGKRLPVEFTIDAICWLKEHWKEAKLMKPKSRPRHKKVIPKINRICRRCSLRQAHQQNRICVACGGALDKIQEWHNAAVPSTSTDEP